MKLFNRFDNLIKNYNIEKSNIIGELSEKTLHHLIKDLYEEDKSKQEIKIGPYYVDILNNKNIIEIQTKQFNKMIDKLTYLLSLNKYNINIIYPIFNLKKIYKEENGKFIGPKTSPKKLKYPEVFYELYKIKKFLKNDKLKITLLVFDIDEYRIKGKSRSGYICFDRIPTKLIKEIILLRKEDYLTLLPSNLNEEFTSSDVSKLSKCNLRYVNNMLNVMSYLEVVEVVGKIGKKYLYKVKH